jgi:hypothetical protein
MLEFEVQIAQSNASKLDKAVVFLGNDSRLRTKIGQSFENSIRSNGKEGFLIYGPYVTLHRGKYRVVLELFSELPFNNILLDIVYAGGCKIISECTIASSSVGEFLMTMPTMTLEEEVLDLEIRIWVPAGVILQLNRLFIESVIDGIITTISPFKTNLIPTTKSAVVLFHANIPIIHENTKWNFHKLQLEISDKSSDIYMNFSKKPISIIYHWLNSNWNILKSENFSLMLPVEEDVPNSTIILSENLQSMMTSEVKYLVVTLRMDKEEGSVNELQVVPVIANDSNIYFKNKDELTQMGDVIIESYYFQHIPKTAGTSLDGILGTVFSKMEICPAGLWSQLLKLPENDRNSYRLYSGHFYSYLDAAVSKPLKKFTFLRDPLERSLSHYAHIMRASDHYLHQRAYELGSLKAFLQDPLCRETIHNFQARSLVQRFDPDQIAQTLNSSENGEYGLEQVLETTPWDRGEAELLADASSALKGFDCLGITEFFEESLELLFATFDWGTPGELRKENVAKSKILAKELDQETRDLLLELIRVDQELYQKAVGMFTRKLAEKRGLGRPDFNYLVEGGGYRTGSTLQYNLVGTYLEKIGYGRRIGRTPPDETDRLIEELAKTPEMILVTKTHHVVQCFRNFRNPTAWADLIMAGEARAMVTNREFSDVKRSMIRKLKIEEATFEESTLWIENVANCKRWREVGAWEQEYNLLVDKPVEAIREFCEAFSIPFIKGAAEGAARATSKGEHLKIMKDVPNGIWDPLTLLHNDHIAEQTRDAILFIAWGDRCIKEVEHCLTKSPALPNCDRLLVTDETTATDEVEKYFKRIIRHPFHLPQMSRKSEIIKFLPDEYEVILFLDSDTLVLENIDLGFEKASTHSMAMAPAPHYTLENYGDFYRTMQLEGIPLKGQMQYNSGVLFFKNSEKAREIFAEWYRLSCKYTDAAAKLDLPETRDDQPMLNLAMQKMDFQPYVLSRSFNYRGFGEPISGLVRIWHSPHEMPGDLNQFNDAWPPRRAYSGRMEAHPIS